MSLLHFGVSNVTLLELLDHSWMYGIEELKAEVVQYQQMVKGEQEAAAKK